MSGWNYRILYMDYGYYLAETFYNRRGNPDGYCSPYFLGKTLGDVQQALWHIRDAGLKTVVNVKGSRLRTTTSKTSPFLAKVVTAHDFFRLVSQDIRVKPWANFSREQQAAIIKMAKRIRRDPDNRGLIFDSWKPYWMPSWSDLTTHQRSAIEALHL